LPHFFKTASVQVQTDDKGPRTAGGKITRGPLGPASQLNQNNKPKKAVDEQFERTTK